MARMLLAHGAALSALLAAAGCATTSGGVAPDPAPAQASVRAAEEMGAPSDPQAALHLQLAREEAQKAQQLIKDGDEERATTLLARAQADGELALAMAKSVRARNEAQQALDHVSQMKQAQANPQANP